MAVFLSGFSTVNRIFNVNIDFALIIKELLKFKCNVHTNFANA